MKRYLSILLSFILLAGFAVANKKASGQEIPVKGYSLYWSDEFNGKALDKTKWNHRGVGKKGEAYIAESTVSLDEKGLLIMEAKVHKDSVLTGMIATEGIFEPCYGYFECRASLTNINGVFPAFWLQSRQNQDHGVPELNGVELDIFEYFQHANKYAVAHTLHWGGYGPTHKVAGPVWGALKDTKDGFHTFGLEWTPDSYTTFVDGVQTYTGNSLISEFLSLLYSALE